MEIWLWNQKMWMPHTYYNQFPGLHSRTMTFEYEDVNLLSSLSRFSALIAASVQFETKDHGTGVGRLMLFTVFLPLQEAHRQVMEGRVIDHTEEWGDVCLQGKKRDEWMGPSLSRKGFSSCSGCGLDSGAGEGVGTWLQAWLLIKGFGWNLLHKMYWYS